MSNCIIGKDTGVVMKYQQLIKNPKQIPVRVNIFQIISDGYHKELAAGWMALTMFLIQQSAIPENIWKDVTYGRIVVN